MSRYQLPPLKEEKLFEYFVCDIFNFLEKTDTYLNSDFQTFGVKGQKQKGIDILSVKNHTVIQCKLKDNKQRSDSIRKTLIQDINTDLENVKDLDFSFKRFIFTSTFRDDAKIQEYLAKLQEEQNLSFSIYYWGWDTLCRYIEENDTLLKKYFPQFISKPKAKSKLELPDNALGKDLLKKNYINYLIKRYGNWKQFELDRTDEKFSWASFNKHIMNKYRASGINYIHIKHFEALVLYLKDRIDKTIFGKNNLAKGRRNYSSFEEHTEGIED